MGCAFGSLQRRYRRLTDAVEVVDVDELEGVCEAGVGGVEACLRGDGGEVVQRRVPPAVEVGHRLACAALHVELRGETRTRQRR